MSEQAKQKVADFGKKGGVKAFASGVKSFVKDVGKAIEKNPQFLSLSLMTVPAAVFAPPVIPIITSSLALGYLALLVKHERENKRLTKLAEEYKKQEEADKKYLNEFKKKYQSR